MFGLMGKRSERKQGDAWFLRAVREDGVSIWYTTEGSWLSATELVRQKKEKFRFANEEELPGEIRAKSGIIFVPLWINPKTGEYCPAGWEIFSNPLMAHAHGGINGKRLTNSREALLTSYQNGYRYFETDIALTADKKAVLSHGWTEAGCAQTGMEWHPEFSNMTYEMFMQQEIDGLHVMDIDGLVAFMREYRDTYFEIDLHKEEHIKKLKQVRKAFRCDRQMMDRLLIQAEKRKTFLEIKRKFDFKNLQLTLGGEWLNKLEEGIAFAHKHGAVAIAMRHNVWTEEAIRIVRASCIHAMAYTLRRDVKKAEKLLSEGVNTICTDYVTPADIGEFGDEQIITMGE